MMKLLVPILVLLFSTHCVAQCGLTGDTLEVYSADDWLQLADCDSVYGSLLIQDWDVSDLSQMGSVVWIEENFILRENISLLNDNDITNLAHVGGDVVYSSNFTLQEINGLANLTHLGGALVFDGNITLESIGPIGAIASIFGDLIIQENHTLEDLGGLSLLEILNGDLFVGHENLILNDFSGLENLNTVEGDFYLSIPSAISVDGFEWLENVNGDMTLENMPLLANLDGFEILHDVSGSLTIQNNGSLVQIDGLSSIDVVGGDLNIHDNTALFWCCGVWPMIIDGSVFGEINIHDNSVNCNSPEEINDYCWVGIESPNPKYSVSMKAGRAEIWSSESFSVTLLSSQGVLISKIQNVWQWSSGELCSGVYLLEIQWATGPSAVRKVMIYR